MNNSDLKLIVSRYHANLDPSHCRYVRKENGNDELWHDDGILGLVIRSNGSLCGYIPYHEKHDIVRIPSDNQNELVAAIRELTAAIDRNTAERKYPPAMLHFVPPPITPEMRELFNVSIKEMDAECPPQSPSS